MGALDNWSDCLSVEMREAWPLLAEAVAGIPGSLVGGTALALHLRHRQSFDLDFMASGAFGGRRVAAALAGLTADIDVAHAVDDAMHATVCGVQVQVFRAPYRGSRPGHVRDLRPPEAVARLPVASLADLLATKLDVILYRPKLRDYIDLRALDTLSPYCLEDGLTFHMYRYGTDPASRDIARIVDLLADPGNLQEDRVFDADRDAALAYLRGRVPAVHAHLERLRAAHPGPPVERSTGRQALGPLPPLDSNAAPRRRGPHLDP